MTIGDDDMEPLETSIVLQPPKGGFSNPLIGSYVGVAVDGVPGVPAGALVKDVMFEKVSKSDLPFPMPRKCKKLFKASTSHTFEDIQVLGDAKANNEEFILTAPAWGQDGRVVLARYSLDTV